MARIPITFDEETQSKIDRFFTGNQDQVAARRSAAWEKMREHILGAGVLGGCAGAGKGVVITSEDIKKDPPGYAKKPLKINRISDGLLNQIKQVRNFEPAPRITDAMKKQCRDELDAFQKHKVELLASDFGREHPVEVFIEDVAEPELDPDRFWKATQAAAKGN